MPLIGRGIDCGVELDTPLFIVRILLRGIVKGELVSIVNIDRGLRNRYLKLTKLSHRLSAYIFQP